jgi:hypothetical protein
MQADRRDGPLFMGRAHQDSRHPPVAASMSAQVDERFAMTHRHALRRAGI